MWQIVCLNLYLTWTFRNLAFPPLFVSTSIRGTLLAATYRRIASPPPAMLGLTTRHRTGLPRHPLSHHGIFGARVLVAPVRLHPQVLEPVYPRLGVGVPPVTETGLLLALLLHAHAVAHPLAAAARRRALRPTTISHMCLYCVKLF